MGDSDEFRGLVRRISTQVQRTAAALRRDLEEEQSYSVVEDRVRGLDEWRGPEDNYRTYRIDIEAEVAEAEARNRRRAQPTRPAPSKAAPTPPAPTPATARVPNPAPPRPPPQPPPPLPSAVTPPLPPPPSPATPQLPSLPRLASPPPSAQLTTLRRLGVDLSPPPPPERPYARIQGRPILSWGSLAPSRHSAELNQLGLLPPQITNRPLPQVGVPPDWDEHPSADQRRQAEALRAEEDKRTGRREAPWERRPLTDFEVRLRTQNNVTVIDATTGERVLRRANYQPVHDPDTGELIGYLDDRIAGGDIVELVDVHGRVVQRLVIGVEASDIQLDDLDIVYGAGKAGGKLAVGALRRFLPGPLGRRTLSSLRKAALVGRLTIQGVEESAVARAVPTLHAERLGAVVSRSAPRRGGRLGAGVPRHGAADTARVLDHPLDIAADAALRAARSGSRPVVAAAELGSLGRVSTTGGFRAALTSKLLAHRRAGVAHPLDFLLGQNTRLRSSWGVDMETMWHNPEIIEAGHATSSRSIARPPKAVSAPGVRRQRQARPDRFMVMSAHNNRLNAALIEHPSVGGYVEDTGAIDILGIPVHPETARDWVAKGLLDARWLAEARIVRY